jgi:hypothetical protein
LVNSKIKCLIIITSTIMQIIIKDFKDKIEEGSIKIITIILITNLKEVEVDLKRKI